MNTNEAFIWASGYYLTDNVTEEMINDQGDMMELFVAEHLLDPFELYPAAAVIEFILEIANSVSTLINTE